MGTAEDVKAAARAWVDRLNDGSGLEGAWRLQRIDRRTTRAEMDGEEVRERPARIRRFAKGIPANFIDEAIRYLISLAPYSDIVFNGTKLEDKYVPTRTWWERDEGATVDRGQMRENTYTLYQDLIDWEHPDETDFDAGGSCSETVHMRYEYDAFSIENVSSGGQGVTVSVQAVSRNEDGTFNYAVVTRKAKTAVGTEQVVKCDEFQKVTQQVYQNLYGFEGGYKDDSDNYFTDFPQPCNDRRTGLLVELSTRKNDDCTYDVTVTRTQSVRVDPSDHTKQKTLRGVTETIVSRNVTNDSVDVRNIGDRVQVELNPDGTYNRTVTTASKESVGDIGSSCQQTVFEHSHVRNENVAQRPGEEATVAGGGKTYQVQARATEEGTWDVSRTTTTEIARPKAQRTKQKTLRGVTETYVDRNVDNSDVTVENIGDRVQVEMTPGGKWNRTVTTVSKESVGDIGSSCQQTVFEHSHVRNENVAQRPGEEATVAGGGKTYQVQARATEEGTWDVSRTTTTEIARPKAQRTKQKTLRGVTETYVDRNVDSNDVTVRNIGDRVQVEMTPGGKWNRTVTTVSKESVGDIGSSCQQTVFEHSHVTNTNVAQRPEEEATVAGGGKTYQVQARATEEGTWDVSRTTTTEIARPKAQRMKQKTLRGVTETYVDRNVDNNDVTVENIGDRVQVEMTPGGKWIRTVTKVSKESVGVIGEDYVITSGQYTYSELRNDTEEPDPHNVQPPDKPKIILPETNREFRIQTRRTDQGTYDVTKSRIVYEPRTGTATSNTALEKTVTTVTVNDTNLNPEAGQGSASISPNDHGSATTSVAEVTPFPLDTDWIRWESTNETANGVYKYNHGLRIFRNLDTVPHMPNSVNCQPTININQWGKYDGHIAYSDLESFSLGGHTGVYGGIQEGTISFWEFMTDAQGKKWKRKLTASSIVYYGYGNEGSEARTMANAIYYPGVHLGRRTYLTEEPKAGNWGAA